MEIENLEVVKLGEKFYSHFFKECDFELMDIDQYDMLYVTFYFHNFPTDGIFREDEGSRMGFELSLEGDTIIYNELDFTYFPFDFTYDFKDVDKLMQYLFNKDCFHYELNYEMTDTRNHGTEKQQNFLEKLSNLIKENEKIPFVLHEEKRKEVEKMRLRYLLNSE